MQILSTLVKSDDLEESVLEESLKQLKKSKPVTDFIKLHKLTKEEVVRSLPTFLYFIEYPNINKMMEPRLRLTQKRIVEIDTVESEYARSFRQQQQASHRLSLYYLPEMMKTATFNDWDMSEIASSETLQKAIQFQKDFCEKKATKGLYISGSFGVGKTHLLAAIASGVTRSGFTVALCFWPEVISYLKTHFDEAYDYVQKLKDVDLLLIDDIGSESITNFTRDDIFLPLMQHRMNFQKATCFSSNLTQEQLLTHFSLTTNGEDTIRAKRIVERISSISEEVLMKGRNRR
ncbi:MAG: ATP-binding protein [Culicoidibacterales bacterium]